MDIQKQLEKMFQILVSLQDSHKRLEDSHKKLEDITGRSLTVIDVLAAGQKDIREKLATKADKKDITRLEKKIDAKADKVDLVNINAKLQNIDAKLVKKLQSHDRRLTNIEEEQGIPHPDKN